MEPYRQRSRRMRELGVLLYMLGLSYRQVSQVLASLGAPVAPTTVLGDVMAAGERARELNRQVRGRVRVRQVGIDGTGVPMAGVGSVGVVVAVDAEQQQALLVETLEERDTDAVREWLEEVIASFAPQEVVTDEAAPYGAAMAEVGVEEEQRPRHRLCAAHFRRNKARRLRELEQEVEKMGAPLLALEAAALRALLCSPPGVLGEAAWRWYWRHYAWLREGEGKWARWRWRMKQLLLELMEKGPQVTGVTNNAAEGAIGRIFKIRMKTMRGMKQEENRDRFLNLAIWMDRQRRRPVAQLVL
jgi:transposase-like protein